MSTNGLFHLEKTKLIMPAQNVTPEVPMSVFKANPSAFAETGAIVTVHNRPRLRVVPLPDDEPEQLAAIKTRLRLLSALLPAEVIEEERRALAADRDADRLDDAR